MKRNKCWKLICCLMLIVILALPGCGATQGKTEETSKNNNTTQEGTNEANASNESDKSGDTSDSEGEERLVGYEQLYDRSLVDGKMAAYFLCPASESVTWAATNYGGDCTLFIMPDGTTVLIDCGTPVDGPTIVWKLQKLGITKLDHFILSHGHMDHIGGFSILSRHIEIDHLYLPPEDSIPRYDTIGRTFWDIVNEKNIPYTFLSEGDTFMLGKDVNVRVFNPPIGGSVDTNKNLNESSLVLRMTYKNSSFLMTGDIGNNEDYGQKTEEVLVAKYGSELASDVVKVGHHGSDKLKGSDIWKETVNAKIYTFTTAYVRSELEYFKFVRTGAKVFSGALDGDVLIYTSGDGTYDVQVSKDRTSTYYGTLDTVEGHLKVK